MLGRSLGGTVAPRVAAVEPSVAGLDILAGGTQPLHWAAVRQMRYLASLNPETAAASQPVIDAMTAQARLVDGPDLSPSTPSSELPFGVPAVAAALGKPILILRGARDYQATVAEDLAGWKAGLNDRCDVKLYPADNHLFFAGAGQSSPAAYEPAQHMDPTVVADVADWLATVDSGVARPQEH